MFKLSPEERAQSLFIHLAHHDQPVDRQVLVLSTALEDMESPVIREKPRASFLLMDDVTSMSLVGSLMAPIYSLDSY